jgi:uncharacterized protein (TIGR02145 family)
MIRAEKAGFKTQEEKISLKAGQVFLFSVNLSIPDVKIVQNGNSIEKSIKLLTGTLMVQSVPVDITINIPWLELSTEKTEDEWIAEDLAIGQYELSFKWKNEVIHDTLLIRENETTHVFVDFMAMKVYHLGSIERVHRPVRKTEERKPPPPPTKTEDPVTTSSFMVTFTDKRDNKQYKQVIIGNQIWMAENLNYYTANGSWCYENNIANCAQYGRLYNWETALRICPNGWRLPTDNDWKQLEMHLGMSSEDVENMYWRGNNEGTQLQKSSNSGFSALLGGRRDSNANFGYEGTYGYYWTATEYGSSNAWYRLLYSGNALIYRFRTNKNAGYSVRCIKNQ